MRNTGYFPVAPNIFASTNTFNLFWVEDRVGWTSDTSAAYSDELLLTNTFILIGTPNLSLGTSTDTSSIFNSES